jgi:hypothetical protein
MGRKPFKSTEEKLQVVTGRFSLAARLHPSLDHALAVGYTRAMGGAAAAFGAYSGKAEP